MQGRSATSGHATSPGRRTDLSFRCFSGPQKNPPVPSEFNPDTPGYGILELLQHPSCSDRRCIVAPFIPGGVPPEFAIRTQDTPVRSDWIMVRRQDVLGPDRT